MDRHEDDDDSLDPNHSGGLWEHQQHPLRVWELRQALEALPADLVVEVERYDGMGDVRKLTPMHLDLRGFDGRAEAVVLLVH